MKEKPLASYIFTSNTTKSQKFIDTVPSGTAAINEVVMQFLCDDLPFGGCGQSGLGRGYNGRSAFDLFTHEKSVLQRVTWVDPYIRYPPYGGSKVKTLIFLQQFRFKDYFAYLALPVLLAIFAMLYKFMKK
jgi:aldehyde dehydrogenase (NAD+)